MDKSCTIQDVFDRFYPAYEKAHVVPAHHRKAAFHIMNCHPHIHAIVLGGGLDGKNKWKDTAGKMHILENQTIHKTFDMLNSGKRTKIESP